jgi:maltooligosyltrehalose trehalohydrolase
MHVGTFTLEGTWRAASGQLAELARLGITMIEMMPVAEFPGSFGWGYDGVNLFAPTRLYGGPDDLRAFIDAAHGTKIAVVLDVVYNHFGPDGNYLPAYSDSYFTDKYTNEWGKAINFDGESSAPVREFFVTNARYWIEEFHFDGLRLDATQSMHDASREHVIAAITRAVREAAVPRSAIVIAENETQHAFMAQSPEQGGFGIDALWNDDFHHSAQVALTGRHEAYYTDYRGYPQEFVSMAKRGFLYQGQYYLWQGKHRGTPTNGLGPGAFIHFLQNHDQVANSCCGQRIHMLTSPGLFRAMTALLLLGPQTPMLFQGQEFAASSPFLYFVDLPESLSGAVHEGRLQFLSQFPSLADPGFQEQLPDSRSFSTFLRSRLDLSERKTHSHAYALHEDLLRLRRDDPVFRKQDPNGLDGAIIRDDAFVLRFFGEGGDDRLLTINLGPDLFLTPMPEPLLAPPRGRVWRLLWSSEDHKYGGLGVPQIASDKAWVVPGKSATVFRPDASEARDDTGRKTP